MTASQLNKGNGACAHCSFAHSWCRSLRSKNATKGPVSKSQTVIFQSRADASYYRRDRAGRSAQNRTSLQPCPKQTAAQPFDVFAKSPAQSQTSAVSLAWLLFPAKPASDQAASSLMFSQLRHGNTKMSGEQHRTVAAVRCATPVLQCRESKFSVDGEVKVTKITTLHRTTRESLF